MPTKDKPRSDELEVSLFGPGFGECVVVHLGGGKWMVVDSCWDFATDRPIALRYFQEIGVDVTTDVVVIVVTHWHDDHIRGAASIVRAAGAAEVTCSMALRNQEFMTLIESAQDTIKLVDHSSGTSELSAILASLGLRGRSGPHRWAFEGGVIFQDAATGIEVRALSPSSRTITDAAVAFGNLLPRSAGPIKRVVEDTPNDVSVVLLVRAPSTSFLLGADLERTDNHQCGWHAVINSNVRPNVKSIGFKVSHHGSENGDVDGIWSDLLVQPPYALVTPYARGQKPLPSDADVARLRRRTPQAYCTAWPPAVRPRVQDKAANRTMDEVAKNRRSIRKTPGHLRLRVPINGVAPPMLAMFNGAVALQPPRRRGGKR